MPFHLNGQEGSQCRQPPSGPYQEQRPRWGHPLLVAQRRDDEEVPIQADHTQVEDGRAAAHNIEAEPNGAKGGPQHPGPTQHVEHGWRHDHKGHHEVGQEQRHQEAVRGAAQGAMGEHQSDEQHVATDCHEDDDSQHEGQQPGAAASDVPSTGGGRAAVVASYGARRVRVSHGASSQP